MCLMCLQHTHTCIYAHMQNNLLSLFIAAHTCMCSGLSTWDQATNVETHPWKKNISPTFSHHWPPVVLHQGVGLCWIDPTHIDLSTNIEIIFILFRQTIAESSYGFFPWHAWVHCLEAGTLALTIFPPPPLGCSLSLTVETALQMYQLVLGTTWTLIIYILTSCESLYSSLSVAKECFFDDRWDLHLSVGINISILLY